MLPDSWAFWQLETYIILNQHWVWLGRFFTMILSWYLCLCFYRKWKNSGTFNNIHWCGKYVWCTQGSFYGSFYSCFYRLYGYVIKTFYVSWCLIKRVGKCNTCLFILLSLEIHPWIYITRNEKKLLKRNRKKVKPRSISQENQSCFKQG